MATRILEPYRLHHYLCTYPPSLPGKKAFVAHHPFFQRALSYQNIRKIVELRLGEVQKRLDGRKMKLHVSEDAKNYLCSIGYSSTYGARPLQRAIMTELLNPLSVYILDDRVRDGETIQVEFDAAHNRLTIVANHEGTSGGNNMDLDYDDEDVVVEELE